MTEKKKKSRQAAKEMEMEIARQAGREPWQVDMTKRTKDRQVDR